MGGVDEANDGGGASSNVMEVTKPDGSDAVTIKVWQSYGTKFAVQVNLKSSVQSFKSVVEQNCDIPAEQQRLIYNGRILRDDQTLKSYGLEAEHTVHLVRRFLPAESTTTSNTVECETMGGLPRSIEVLRRIRDSPEMIAAVNRDPYLARNINNPDIYRQTVEDRIYIERIRELFEYNYNRFVGHGGGSGATQNPYSNPQNRNQQSVISQPEQQQSTRDEGQMDGGTVDLEQLYASQLAQLQGLGFSDNRQNLEALTATAGSVPGAVHRLLVNIMIADEN